MSKYETPDYTVIEKEGPFEIRLYDDFFIVEYENQNDPDINYGFGTLFKYISKDNAQNEKINMTIPVFKETTGTGTKMAFVIPKNKWENIPKPNDSRLSIQPFEKGTFACIIYSGSWSDTKEKEQMQRLEIWLKQKNLKPISTMMVAVYNGPFIPAPFRRNEILVRIDTANK